MHYVILVQVTHSLQCLCEVFKCFGFGKAGFGILVSKQVASISVLHNHVDPLIFNQGIPQSDHLRMLQLGMQANLTLDQLHLAFRRNLCEVDLHEKMITILMAYVRQVRRWRASLTVPKLPHPTLPSISWNSVIEVNLPCAGTFNIRNVI